MPEPFKMPTVPKGLVYWRRQPADPPEIAFVTEVGTSAVSVTIFGKDNRGGVVRDGVKHLNDPSFSPQNDSGCWDYTDEAKLLKVLWARHEGAPLAPPAQKGK